MSFDPDVTVGRQKGQTIGNLRLLKTHTVMFHLMLTHKFSISQGVYRVVDKDTAERSGGGRGKDFMPEAHPNLQLINYS